MTTPASPAVTWKGSDGAEFPIRELTLHPSDDAARQAIRVLEEFHDAAIGFQRAARDAKTPEERKKAVLLAAEMRHERDLAFRDFLMAYTNDIILINKVLKQCGDTDMEIILMAVREGSFDSQRKLYEKLSKLYAPLPSSVTEPKPNS